MANIFGMKRGLKTTEKKSLEDYKKADRIAFFDLFYSAFQDAVEMSALQRIFITGLPDKTSGCNLPEMP